MSSVTFVFEHCTTLWVPVTQGIYEPPRGERNVRQGDREASLVEEILG